MKRLVRRLTGKDMKGLIRNKGRMKINSINERLDDIEAKNKS